MKGKWMKIVRQYTIITLGISMMAVGVYFFKFPNNFVFGGVTGAAALAAKLTPISASEFSAVVNMLMLLLGLIFLGKEFALTTGYATVVLSAELMLLEKACPLNAPLSDQPMLELIFAIALPAIASALLFSVGASSGGTDVIALIVEKYTHLHSIAAALFLTDLVMVVAACFVFDLHTALYSFVGLTVKSLMIDVVLERMKMCKAILIVCDDKEPICDFVNKELNRGATYTPCNGAYTNQPRYIIYTTLTRHEAMQLREFIHKVAGVSFFKPRVIICVPSGITEVEERAVIDAGIQAGARKVYLIEEPVAAAIGAGIDITKPEGHMVVDIGGGTSDIAVISLKGVVESASIKVAGDQFNEAIVKYMRRKHNILIGERTAEQMKMQIGCVFPKDEETTIEIKGRCLMTGLPKTITVTSTEMLEAFEEPVERILEAIHGVLERTPPELVADIANNGIVMTGGGSLVDGFDKLITARTGIHTVVAENAISCVAIGTGKSLDSVHEMNDGTVNLSRRKQMN